MQFKKSLMTSMLFAIGGLAAISSANAAGTATGQFDVKLNITSVCSVDATSGAQDIDFGSHAAGTTAAEVGVAQSSTDIAVTCSKNAPYIVNLTPVSTNSDDGAGTMSGPGTDTIDYQLYSDAAATEAWGNLGVLGTENNGVAGVGEGLTVAANTHTVYANLTSTTDIQLGDYSDTVNVAVTY